MKEMEAKSVFEQLGLTDHEELETKACLASVIRRVTVARGMTDKQVGLTVDISTSEVSKIMGADLSGFTVEKLGTIVKALENGR